MSNIHGAVDVASPWVRRFAPLIPQGGTVLDLACGAGRHAKLLAELGFSVLAVDQNIEAISSIQNSKILPQCHDLETEVWPLEGLKFDAIVVTNYLFRPHLGRLPGMLTENGVLIYETFAQGNAIFGKPSNPNFLLNPGELLALASEHQLKILAYEDIYVDQPKPAMVQRLCAVKGLPKEHVPLQFQA